MKILAIIAVVAVVMIALISTLKKSMVKKLIHYLEESEFESFYKDIDSTKTKLLLPKMSILDMKLNAEIVQQNKNNIDVYILSGACRPTR